jgi:NTE family protein
MSPQQAIIDMQGSFAARHTNGDFLNADKLEDVIGFCLSGGGYRAMGYHVGALVRLNELGFLAQLREVASVSGGSITAGMLALAWRKLRFDAGGRAGNLIEEVANPLIRFAAIGVDIKAVLAGLLPGRTAADAIATAYDRHLFGGATLQDIPDEPRFTFMATNLQTGSGWRFAKSYAADSAALSARISCCPASWRRHPLSRRSFRRCGSDLSRTRSNRCQGPIFTGRLLRRSPS